MGQRKEYKMMYGDMMYGDNEMQTYEMSKALYFYEQGYACLLYTSPSPRDGLLSRMPSSA